MKKIQTKKGFSLTEIILVMGIAATIIVATFIAYKVAFSSSSVNSEVKIAGQIAQDISEIYAMAPNYNGVNTESVIKNGLVPSARVPGGYSSGTQIIHKISGEDEGFIKVEAVTNSNSADSSGQYFRIQFNNVPTKECIDLAKQSSQNFDIIYISSGSSGGDEVKEQGEQLDIESLVDECNNRNDNVISLIKA